MGEVLHCTACCSSVLTAVLVWGLSSEPQTEPQTPSPAAHRAALVPSTSVWLQVLAVLGSDQLSSADLIVRRMCVAEIR